MYKREFNDFQEERGSEDIYSIPVRAGKRTYFFDVKSTRGRKDFYLTITESKRHNNPDGSFSFDKHKIFLYKEDFEKFAEGLEEVINYINAGFSVAFMKAGEFKKMQKAYKEYV